MSEQREALTEAQSLLDCACGHSLDEHNGLGCYARLSYQPLVTCGCKLTDDRTHAELLAPHLARLLAEAWDEGWEAGCNDQQYGDENAQPWTPNPYATGDCAPNCARVEETP